MNQRALADRMGLKSRGSIQNWEANYDEVPARHYAKLVRVLGIPPEDFLAAVPPERREIARGMLIAEGFLARAGADAAAAGNIPVVGSASGDPDTRFLWEELEGEPPLDFSGCVAVRVVGDSMSPVALPGQYVLFRPDSTATDGDLAVVRLGSGETLFKRIYFDRERRQLTLVSVKTGHRPKTVDLDDVEWIHRVVGIRF